MFVPVSDIADPVPRRQTNRICKGHLAGGDCVLEWT